MGARVTLCTFHLDDHWFGVEVANVQQVLHDHDVTALRWAHEAVKGLLNLRGQIVTAVDLRALLGMEPRSPEARAANMVVHIGGAAVSLWVDGIGDVVEADASAFERAPGTLPRMSRDLVRGVFRLEGRLLLALDLPRVMGALMV